MKRSACPITCTLDILGDKWTLIILRDAVFAGHTTFGQFKSSHEKIATNILAARLSKMTEEGLFIRENDPNNKLKIHYKLTPKGRALKDVLLAVGKWGNNHIKGTVDMTKKIEALGSE